MKLPGEELDVHLIDHEILGVKGLPTLDARYVNISGDLMIGTNSTTFFQIQQADTTPVFNVDTTNRKITVSSGTTGQSTIGAGLIVNNDSGNGAINDFQVNSDTLTALFVDASANTLAIGVDTTINDGKNIVLNTTTGTKIGTAVGQKLGFWNVTPVVQQVFATGASHTVDELITMLQTLGLVKQS